MTEHEAAPDAAPEGAQRFKKLPDRVPLEELTTDHPASDAADPDALVEPTGDWMHRPF
jgi:hypothetical protein